MPLDMLRLTNEIEDLAATIRKNFPEQPGHTLAIYQSTNQAYPVTQQEIR